jgi:TolA-binding protein
MNAPACPDDLLVAARSRWLSDLERQALSVHLARCEQCRAGELAAGLYRQPLGSAVATPADRALVERVAERASLSLAKVPRHAHGGWRRVAVVVAVFLGLGGVASAWIGRSLLSPRAVERAPAPSVSSVGRRAHVKEHALAPLPPPAAPALSPAPGKKLVAARPARETLVAAAAPETAASLFTEAARARHEGDLRRAVALYRTLRSVFPDSDQARVASISMGDLFLRLDEPASALRAFDAYLSEVRAGSLREEALSGRARCLKLLREEAAEADTWARLTREFPGSAYATIARQRLEELRRVRSPAAAPTP